MKYTVFDANGNVIRPVIRFGYSQNDDLVSMADSSANIAARLQNDVMSTLHGTDHDKENFKLLCVELGLIEQTADADTKAELFSILTNKALSRENVSVGNIALFDGENGYRNPVSENTILAAGYMSGGTLWTIPKWPPSFGYQTLFLQVYKVNDSYVIATPILGDGTVMTKAEFEAYISACCAEEDAMTYDSENNSIIAGIMDNESDAKFCAQLIDEWEDHLMTSSIADAGLYKLLVNKAIENQDKSVKEISLAVGITDENVVGIVNRIYPFFNAADSTCAWGRLQRLLYHELWNVLPIGGETNA